MPHKLYIKEEEKNDEWKHLPKKESSSKCEKVNIISYSTYADAAGADDDDDGDDDDGWSSQHHWRPP